MGLEQRYKTVRFFTWPNTFFTLASIDFLLHDDDKQTDDEEEKEEVEEEDDKEEEEEKEKDEEEVNVTNKYK